MRWRLATATIVAATLGCSLAVVSAQAEQPASGEKVTVTGCLQRAQRNGSVGGTIVGTSAAPNRADDEANSGALVNAFLLTDAIVARGSGAPSAGASASPAATGTAGRAPEPTTFGLRGKEAELEQHQGARVEVTGTVIPPASSGQGTGGAATAAGARRLEVVSYRVVAEKCTAP